MEPLDSHKKNVGKCCVGTHRKWGHIQSGEIGHTDRGVPASRGGVALRIPPPFHKLVSVSRLGECLWVMRKIENFFGEVGEELKRQDAVAPSLWSEVLLRAYLKEAARGSHCQVRAHICISVDAPSRGMFHTVIAAEIDKPVIGLRTDKDKVRGHLIQDCRGADPTLVNIKKLKKSIDETDTSLSRRIEPFLACLRAHR